MARATTAHIHIDALRHNLAVVRARAPHAKVMAVVKADGYGHGLERVAHALAGADGFGVAALSDAQRLRAAGFSQKILLLSGFDEPADIVCMSHLASSEDTGSPQTAEQLRTFGDHLPPSAAASIANSAGILIGPAAHRQWLRAGGALYGLAVGEGKTGADFRLRPAMTLSTRLISVQTVAKGERIGYSGIYTCPEDMPVGVAAIGYGDGYPRLIRPGTPVLLNGRRVPIIGRVSMDLMTLDLRSQPEAAVGDPVVLWGEGLPVEEVA